MNKKLTSLTDKQIDDLSDFITDNARTEEKAVAAATAVRRYITINRISDNSPIANIDYGSAAATQAKAFEDALNIRLDTVLAML